jgi:uncharacterized sporulation protein YeaH/YhbH (DUF444 family)
MPPEEFKMKPLKPKPNPEFKAVVVIVLDLTGSVFWDHKGVVPQEVAKNLMYNIVALLKAKYTEIELRFVGYDWDAHEFPEKKIWHTMLGGGNKDSTGYIKAKEILDEYPNSSWNKYVYGTGDGGSTDTEATIKAMEEIYEDVQHMAFIANRVNPSWGSEGEGSFLHGIKQLAEKHQWFDYTSINHERGTLIKALDDMFLKTKK